MALVTNFERSEKDRHTVHKPTVCAFSTFVGPDNHSYLQLDTFGSDDREIPGKVSQSIQLGANAAAELKRLIERTFPGVV